jgi:hypothetical protein
LEPNIILSKDNLTKNKISHVYLLVVQSKK